MKTTKMIAVIFLTSYLFSFLAFGHGGEDHGAPKQLQAPNQGNLVKEETGHLYLELVKSEESSLFTLFPYELDHHKKLKVVDLGDAKFTAKGISKRKGSKIFSFKKVNKKYEANLEFKGVNVFELQVIINHHGKDAHFKFTVELEDED